MFVLSLLFFSRSLVLVNVAFFSYLQVSGKGISKYSHVALLTFASTYNEWQSSALVPGPLFSTVNLLYVGQNLTGISDMFFHLMVSSPGFQLAGIFQSVSSIILISL